ncbi:MAG: hypothetical protein KJ957_05305 [Candidatus Omnitrophica bacterium]|nr:hypothetical protein [Candidatus Omnitrophota bacterium]
MPEKDNMEIEKIYPKISRFKDNGKHYFREKGDNSSSIGAIQENDVIGRLEYVKEGEGQSKKYL